MYHSPMNIDATAIMISVYKIPNAIFSIRLQRDGSIRLKATINAGIDIMTAKATSLAGEIGPPNDLPWIKDSR